jgi:hypothetical protein
MAKAQFTEPNAKRQTSENENPEGIPQALADRLK